MCGIAGVKSKQFPPIQVLERMVETLIHRGPDASGWYQTCGYMAGMRRLAVNDVAGGNQPLYNADRAVVLFYPVSYQNFGLPLNKRLKILADYASPQRAWAWHYYAAESEKAKLFASAPFENSLPSQRYFSEYKKADWQPVDYIRQDQQFYFPFEMLRKADRMTMVIKLLS